VSKSEKNDIFLLLFYGDSRLKAGGHLRPTAISTIYKPTVRLALD
jgi:hypothetical protein